MLFLCHILILTDNCILFSKYTYRLTNFENIFGAAQGVAPRILLGKSSVTVQNEVVLHNCRLYTVSVTLMVGHRHECKVIYVML